MSTAMASAVLQEWAEQLEQVCSVPSLEEAQRVFPSRAGTCANCARSGDVRCPGGGEALCEDCFLEVFVALAALLEREYEIFRAACWRFYLRAWNPTWKVRPN